MKIVDLRDTKRVADRELSVQEKEIRALAAAYKRTFSTKDGQRVLEDLKEVFHMFESTFRGTTDGIAYSEGQRTVVLYILDKIKTEEEER